MLSASPRWTESLSFGDRELNSKRGGLIHCRGLDSAPRTFLVSAFAYSTIVPECSSHAEWRRAANRHGNQESLLNHRLAGS